MKKKYDLYIGQEVYVKATVKKIGPNCIVYIRNSDDGIIDWEHRNLVRPKDEWLDIWNKEEPKETTMLEMIDRVEENQTKAAEELFKRKRVKPCEMIPPRTFLVNKQGPNVFSIDDCKAVKCKHIKDCQNKGDKK